jgi:hypothetical protein
VPNDEDDDDLQILEEIPVQREIQKNLNHTASSRKNEQVGEMESAPDHSNENQNQNIVSGLSEKQCQKGKKAKASKNKTGKFLQVNVSRLNFQQSKSKLKVAKPDKAKTSKEKKCPVITKLNKHETKNKQKTKKSFLSNNKNEVNDQSVSFPSNENARVTNSENSNPEYFFQVNDDIWQIMDGSALEMNDEVDVSHSFLKMKKKKPILPPKADSKTHEMAIKLKNGCYVGLIMTAINTINVKEGSTRQDIANFLMQNLTGSTKEKQVKQNMRRILRSQVKKGILLQQSFKPNNPKFKMNYVKK